MDASLFSDFDSFTDEFLPLKVKGKTYRLEPVGIRTGGLLRRAADGDAAAMAELDTGERYYRALLGGTYDEMLADDAPEAAVNRAALTALAWFSQGPAAALVMWQTGKDPKALEAAIKLAQEMIAAS